MTTQPPTSKPQPNKFWEREGPIIPIVVNGRTCIKVNEVVDREGNHRIHIREWQIGYNGQEFPTNRGLAVSTEVRKQLLDAIQRASL